MGHEIGFVPTMGALHDGHYSLVRASLENKHYTVVSIFVNPTQFNNADDLKKYPRTEGDDLEALITAGADVVFLPSVEEVYPPDAPPSPTYQFEGLDETMEGKMRPGHFQGVAQVVNRLLELTIAQHLYMGQKDFQQVAIVNKMIEITGQNVKMHVCPIVRAESGLAKSSRNVRLTAAQQKEATLIFKTLKVLKKRFLKGESPAALSSWAMDQFTREGWKPEYVSIVDGKNLKRYKNFGKADFVVACAATWVGDVRLIDNMILQNS